MDNNRTWEALSMKDRASFIKLAIQNGYRDLDSIRGLYNNSYAEGGPKESYFSTPNYLTPEEVLTKKLSNEVKIPYRDTNREISRYTNLPVGVDDITEGTEKGYASYYNMNDFFGGKDFKIIEYNNKYYKIDNGSYEGEDYGMELPKVNLTDKDIKIVPYSEYRKRILPKRDYIGGTPHEVRLKASEKIPDLHKNITDLAYKYGLNPSLLFHRFTKEGYLDKAVNTYNDTIDTVDQKDFWNTIAEKEVNGFQALGLDNTVNLIDQGLINLRNPNLGYYSSNNTNEKGEEVLSPIVDNLWDGLELKAAEMEYRQNELKKRGYTGKNLDTWTNAAYNLGLYHKDLKDAEWINKNYSVPEYDYFKTYPIIKKDLQPITIPNKKYLGGPLYNQNNPIESFQGNPYIPIVRYDVGGPINPVSVTKNNINREDTYFPTDHLLGDYYGRNFETEDNQNILIVTPEKQSSTGNYTVKAGDTLSKIAKLNNVSLKDILSINPEIKNPNIIRVGQNIKLPYLQENNNDAINLNPVTKQNNVGEDIAFSSVPKFEYTEYKDSNEYKKDKDKPVSLLYKEVEGKNWPGKGVEYAGYTTGSNEANLKIKEVLLKKKAEQYDAKHNIYKITKSSIKGINNVGEVEQKNIDNPVGIDYSSPKTIPITDKGGEVSSLQNIFTFNSEKAAKDNIICDSRGCAASLTSTVVSKDPSLINLYNYRGDAWTVLPESRKAGIETVNLYDSLSIEEKMALDSGDKVVSATNKLLKDNENFKADIRSNLVPGNLVTLLYPSSSHYKEAAEQSNYETLSTHVGVVVQVGGQLKIADIVGGKVYFRNIDDLLSSKSNGIKITGMAKQSKKEGVKKSMRGATADLSKFGISLNSDLNRTDRISSPSTYRAEESLHKNSNVLQKEFDVSGRALNLASILMPALMYRETSSGSLESPSYKSHVFGVHALKASVGELLQNNVSESIGLTNVKLKDENNFFSSEDLKKLGLDKRLNRTQKESPELTGVLTPIALDRRMKKLDNILGEAKQHLSNEDYLALLIMSWSQGFDNIETNINNFKSSSYSDYSQISPYVNADEYQSIKTYLSYLYADKDIFKEIFKFL